MIVQCEQVTEEIGGGGAPKDRYKLAKIAVRENLMSALRHLRHQDMSRTLWIDAICINQKDTTEKSVQLPRLADIYRWAERVVIWLGPEADNSSLAIGTLQYRQYERSSQGVYMRSPDSTEPKWFHDQVILPYDESSWTAIRELLDRDWFWRLWTFQEANLAHRTAIVHCGSVYILLSELRRAASSLRNKKGSQHYRGMKDVLANVMNSLAPRTGYVLDSLLTSTQSKECSELKDRVYAILGMLPVRFSSKVTVSYDDSLSVGRLYEETLLLHVSSTKRLDLFKHCENSRRVDGLPSWVPDLSGFTTKRENMTGHFCSGYSCTDAVYTASGATQSETLRASGCQSGRVTFVSDRLPSEWDEWEQLCIKICERVDARTELSPENRQTVLEAFAFAIAGGKVKERFSNFSFPLLADWADAIATQSEGELWRWPNTARTGLEICHGRRLIEMDGGPVGNGPEDAQTGDCLVVLLGCPMPILLRPKKGCMEIVGECYVYGLQDAISLLGPLPPPWRILVDWGIMNRLRFRFLNTETGELTPEDPRLTPFGCDDWGRFEKEPDAGDPEYYDFFRHKETGEVMNSDPRMLPERLKAHGVDIQTFCLV